MLIMIMIMMIINCDIYINHVDNDNDDKNDNFHYNFIDDNKDLMLLLNPVTCSISLTRALSLILFRTFLCHFVLL